MRFGKLDCRQLVLASILAVSTANLASAQYCNDFLVPKKFDAGVNPVAVAVGDVTADGSDDLAVAYGMSIAVLEHIGLGTFLPEDDYFVGSTATSVVLADFNGDNYIDMAAGGLAGDNVSVRLNNGFGTLGSPASYPSDAPRALVAADFNGDGDPDLAVANGDNDTVSVLINNGSGVFAAGVPYAVGDGPASLAVGDFDYDGDRDLVAGNGATNTVSVLLNDGDGTFADSDPFTSGANAAGVATGLFNGDNAADIAVTVSGSDNVAILMSNGNGTFAAAVTYPVGDNPGSIAAGDLNADGRPDLVVANRDADTFTVLFGQSNGTFTGATQYGSGVNPSAIAIADLNEDGIVDIAVTSGDSYDVRAFFGVGGGVFSSHHGADSFPDDVIARDFDGDGHQDFASAASDLNVSLGRGDGAFEPMASYDAGALLSALAAGYFNNDVILDIAAASYVGVDIFLGNGDGTFGSPTFVDTPDDIRDLVVADVDFDGNDDLVMANWQAHDVSVVNGNGNGTFDAAVSYDVGDGTYALVVADFTGDNRVDVAVAKDSGVAVLLNNGTGTLGTPVPYTAGTFSTAITAGDFNDDGKLDLAVGNRGSNDISVLLGGVNGTFGAAAHYDLGFDSADEPADLVATDLTGDGVLDLAIAVDHNTTFFPNLFLIEGLSNGTFADETQTLHGDSNWGIALDVADFNEDGAIDIVIAESQQVAVALNRSNCTSAATVTPNSGPQAGGQTVTIGGVRLSGAESVMFGGTAATITGNTPTSITVVTPAHAPGAVTVVVQAAGGTDSIVNGYTYQVSSPGIPTGLVATAINSTRIDLTWIAVSGATSYQIDRKSPGTGYVQIGTSATSSYSDTTVYTGASFVYRVRAVNGAGTSGNSTSDLATTLFFTDANLTVGMTVKAVHLAELRTAVNSVRTLAGLGAGSYTNAAIPGVLVKAVHITELRTAVDAARSLLGLSTGGYTDASVSGIRVKRIHMQDVRNRTQ